LLIASLTISPLPKVEPKAIFLFSTGTSANPEALEGSIQAVL
tara:strand:+ start:80 stop:205 length:126 start_codon:yes stop_codon:yes gene_type:complete